MTEAGRTQLTAPDRRGSSEKRKEGREVELAFLFFGQTLRYHQKSWIWILVEACFLTLYCSRSDLV